MKVKTANITTGQIFVPRQFSVISGDKTDENLQISKLKVKNLQK